MKSGKVQSMVEVEKLLMAKSVMKPVVIISFWATKQVEAEEKADDLKAYSAVVPVSLVCMNTESAVKILKEEKYERKSCDDVMKKEVFKFQPCPVMQQISEAPTIGFSRSATPPTGHQI